MVLANRLCKINRIGEKENWYLEKTKTKTKKKMRREVFKNAQEYSAYYTVCLSGDRH